MTNKEIRRRAWELCRENFRTILGASFLISLISSLMINITYLLGKSVLSSFLSIGFVVLNSILTLGMIRFILNIWHGQPAPLSALFSQRHRFWTNALYGLLMGLILTVVLVVAVIPMVIAVSISETMSVLGLVIFLAAFALSVWLMLRFEMTTVCIVLRPFMGTMDSMRTAWRASKGNAGRLFCNGFVLNLPLFVAQALLMGYQFFLGMRGQTLNLFGSIVLDIASMLISALLTGYIALGTYALHEQLLDSYDPQPIGLPSTEESGEEDEFTL